MKRYFYITFILICLLSSNLHSQSNKITILHTNDTHSRIEALSLNDKKFPGYGGYVYRNSIVKNIKNNTDNVLIFDAGDFFQGTPYFNFFEGELEIELMNKIEYTAVTLGNHEFDNGIEKLTQRLHKAQFPIISTNYDFRNTSLKDIIKPWLIKKIGKYKVGIIAVGVNPEGLISPINFEGVGYMEPYSIAEQTAEYLKNKMKCNLIVCLSHLGYQQPHGVKNDVEMANQTKYIDIIIGGHTHTLLKDAMEVINNQNHKVLITQCANMGVFIGRIDVEFER